MKHLKKSNILAGAAVTLTPPFLGAYSSLSSYEASEVIDLICDGPIEGLVNNNGYLLEPSEYFQGVYLNDVPVQETQDVVFTANNPISADFGEEIATAYSSLSRNLYSNGNPAKHPTWGPFIRVGDNCWFVFNFYFSAAGTSNNTYTKGETADFFCRVPPGHNLDGYCAYNSDFPAMRNRSNLTDAVGGYMKSAKSKKNFSTNFRNHRMEVDLTDSGFTAEIAKLGTTTPANYDSVLRSYTDYYMPPTRQGWQNGYTSYTMNSNSYFSNAVWGNAYREIQRTNKVIGINSDIFWSKDVGNWYLETSLNETYSFNKIFENTPQSNSPVCRNRIRNAASDIIDKLTNNEQKNRFLEEFIVNRLQIAGLSKEQGELATFDSIKNLVKKYIQEDRIISFYSGGCDPYIFLTHNDSVIDGYDENLHKDLFKNQDTYVENFVENKTYKPGESFFVSNFYYTVKSQDFSGVLNDVFNDLGRQEQNRLLLQSTELGSQTNKDAFFYIGRDISLEDQESTLQGRTYGSKFLDLLMPVLDDEGNWAGKVFGFTIENINTSPEQDKNPSLVGTGYVDKGAEFGSERYRLWTRNVGRITNWNEKLIVNGISQTHYDYYNQRNRLYVANVKSNNSAISADAKYNYSNVLIEFRDGSKKQSPLSYFKDLFIDKYYNSPLLGPFSTYPKSVSSVRFSTDQAGPQRLRSVALQEDPNLGVGKKPDLNFAWSRPPAMGDNWLVAQEEVSEDVRIVRLDDGSAARNFSLGSAYLNQEQKASPITHIINNPNVKKCFVTLDVQSLFDTAEDEDVAGSASNVGKRFAAPLNIRVEVGLIDKSGTEKEYYSRYFQIIAKIEQSTLIDLGNEYNKDNEIGKNKFVKELDGDVNASNIEAYNDMQKNVSNPFVLPEIEKSSEEKFEETEVQEDSSLKRYIKITKINVETYSPLTKRKVYISKITEVLPYSCSYPLSATVGIKTDSRNFPSIPIRTYRCKLKKIKVPSNYTILSGLKDKRYWDKKSDFEKQERKDLRLYQGDWDGTFKVQWTDNPAWILYDVLTSERYGLGKEIDVNKINKWQLYEIARFCDSVDKEGYYLGVDDGRGGIEPRFSCNIVFDTETKIFDVINSISSLFRGLIYYSNGSITFRDDRLTDPVAIFNNENVREGVFSYSNYKKEESYNAVEVVYKDKFNDYKTKIEYVEDQEDIIKRGVFRKRFTAVGVTSKAMAKRAAYHVMIQTTKENESVSFFAGSEALLCNPGDLIIVDDTLKSLSNNYGRILDIDTESKSIRISAEYDDGFLGSEMKVYIPTGNQVLEDFDGLSAPRRQRTESFIMQTGVNQEINNNFTGFYGFVDYISGFENLADDNLYEQYPYYENTDKNTIAYYHTGYTGWVFSSGLIPYEENLNSFIMSGQVFDLNDITNPEFLEIQENSYIHYYDTNQTDRRGSFAEFGSGKFLDSNENQRINFFNGILSKEIQTDSAVQIRTFKIASGQNQSDQKNKLGFGDIVYLETGDINTSLLGFVKKGSAFRIARKNSSDLIYKINSIKEQDTDNTYAVSASKYYSGKYREIEENFNERELEDTYGHDKDFVSVNQKRYVTLDAPDVTYLLQNNGDSLNLSSKSFITGSFEPVDFATGYSITSIDPDFNYNSFKIESDENAFSIESIKKGWYNFSIKSLAEPFNNNDLDKFYLDSVEDIKRFKAVNVTEEDDGDDEEDLATSFPTDPQLT